MLPHNNLKMSVDSYLENVNMHIVHIDLEILLFSNLDSYCPADPEMLLHNNLEILLVLKCNSSEKFE